MNLDFKIVGSDICVKLSGEIDEYSARNLRADIDKLIDAQGFRTMTFDMKNVTFIDSTGLGFVLGRYKKLRGKRAELLLKNVPQQVDKVFRTSGIYTFVPIVE
ncbi:MAG: STAS domain-containing protein [Clostridia bacterium]|nr:STAS domain-containing protein [Clostridia bacterium]